MSDPLSRASFVPFVQNAVQPVDLLCPLVVGQSGHDAGEWIGQDTPHGLVGVGAIQMQYRLQK